MEEAERDEAVVPSGEELAPGPASELGVPPHSWPLPSAPLTLCSKGKAANKPEKGQGCVDWGGQDGRDGAALLTREARPRRRGRTSLLCSSGGQTRAHEKKLPTVKHPQTERAGQEA